MTTGDETFTQTECSGSSDGGWSYSFGTDTNGNYYVVSDFNVVGGSYSGTISDSGEISFTNGLVYTPNGTFQIGVAALLMVILLMFHVIILDCQNVAGLYSRSSEATPIVAQYFPEYLTVTQSGCSADSGSGWTFSISTNENVEYVFTTDGLGGASGSISAAGEILVTNIMDPDTGDDLSHTYTPIGNISRPYSLARLLRK